MAVPSTRKAWAGPDFDYTLMEQMFYVASIGGLLLALYFVIRLSLEKATDNGFYFKRESYFGSWWQTNYRGDYPKALDERCNKEPRDFFDKKEKAIIKKHIKNFEKKSSCEIRVHIAKGLGNNPKIYAEQIFKKLKMHRTKRNNATLLCIGLLDSKVKIYNDAAIRWELEFDHFLEIEKEIQKMFDDRKYYQRICEGINKLAELLSDIFPWQDTINELSDELSFEK